MNQCWVKKTIGKQLFKNENVGRNYIPFNPDFEKPIFKDGEESVIQQKQSINAYKAKNLWEQLRTTPKFTVDSFKLFTMPEINEFFKLDLGQVPSALANSYESAQKHFKSAYTQWENNRTKHDIEIIRGDWKDIVGLLKSDNIFDVSKAYQENQVS